MSRFFSAVALLLQSRVMSITTCPRQQAERAWPRSRTPYNSLRALTQPLDLIFLLQLCRESIDFPLSIFN
ncbi:hypothetical protein AB7M56_006126 [Bradyrhizobium elkanii]|nr:hypothetical protein [Bradyrhizobium elkanii]MCS4066955.1 hypothetical protein [Bradyrhizobium elkanii]MCS4082490.1 hypothetical protein [Bradyrhizobium elkanii]MCW2127891.1 hypothetical protein [Bradyrhizobium elkanii]MCW2174634.1 hypothetical protein [Bradyrhizobium elkanii]